MSRRSGLGRGLDALIPAGPEGMPEESSTGGAPDHSKSVAAVLSVPITSIVPNTYQPRKKFESESLEQLADSIREIGVLQPLIVRPNEDGTFELVAGERRWRASQIAGLTEVPVIVRRTADAESLEQAIVENLHREDLNSLEEAAALRQLIDEFGYTQEQVARRVGRSRPAVANLLRLLQLPGEIQAWVRDGNISAGHARAILVLNNPDAQVALARRIMTEGLSVREAEELGRARVSGESEQRPGGRNAVTSPSRPTGSGSGRPAGVLELEELLSERLNTRVTVELTAKHGKVVVEFADLDDLERIYRMIIDE